MEFVWSFVVVNVADLVSCYSDVKGCFGQDYNNIFLALVRLLWLAFYKIAWNLWCAPPVVWCLLLAFSFRHIASTVKLGSWSFLFVWALFLQSPKPWNFDSDRLRERNYFVLEDLHQGWAIFVAQVAFFSLAQAPKKLHQVILHISDYVGSSLDFKISFPDVWVECNLPASTDSLSDMETKRLVNEEAEARDRRREAELLVTELEQVTLEIPTGKVPELSQPYPPWRTKSATKHTWSISNKTARLQSRFGFPTSRDVSTQTDDIICERCFGKKDDTEADEICVQDTESDAVSDTPCHSETAEPYIRDKDVVFEDEVEEIPTGIHWNVSTESQLEDEQIQEDVFHREEPEPALEATSTVELSLETTQDEIGVTTENIYDTDTPVDELSPLFDFRQEVPHDAHHDIQQDFQLDSQPGISHEEPTTDIVPDTRIDPTTFNTETLEATEATETIETMETQEMVEVSQSGGQQAINYIGLERKPEVSEDIPVFPAADFGLHGLTSQIVDNVPVLMQVDQENPEAVGTEKRPDVDSDGDDDMSLFEDLYSDDRSEEEHPTIGAAELNTRLLAALEPSEAPQELSHEVDNADDLMVSRPVETINLLGEEMDLELSSTEIETNTPNSPADVDMGGGSEPDMTAMDPQEIQMSDNDGEANAPIFSQYWNHEIEPQQPAEVEMLEIFNHPGPFPEPAASEAPNEMDELENDLWLEFLRMEEEEEDSDHEHEAQSPSEEEGLWAPPPGFSIPVFSASRFAVNQDDEPNNDSSPSPSGILDEQDLEEMGNNLESESADEPRMNTEEEIVARPKLVPRSRRARHIETQPETQAQEQQVEDLFVGGISDLVEKKVLSLLEYGFGIPGEASNAADAPVSNARNSQDSIENLGGTLESLDQVQVDESHDESKESKPRRDDELPNISITVAPEDGPEQPQETDGSQQNQPSLDLPPMKLGALLLPGGNHGILGSLPSPAPDVEPESNEHISNTDAGEGALTPSVPKTPDRKGKGRADQEDHVPAINIGGLTFPGGNPVQNISPSPSPQPESSSFPTQPTPPESVSDVDASEEGSVISVLETLRPRSPIDLQQRELERLKKKYAKPGRNSPSIFRTPRRTQAQSSSTPGTPSRTVKKEVRSETGTTGELIFSQSPKPTVKIASPASLIKHLKETGEGGRGD